MQGVEIKKSYLADFEKIYPLLKEFNSPYSKEAWKKIFTYEWDRKDNFVGFHLEYQHEIVGFMGLIFSLRNKGNEKFFYCNITSLIVKKEFRASTILLIRKLKSLENTILTGLRPIYESYRLLELVGFRPYEHEYRIMPVLLQLFRKKITLTYYEMPLLLDQLDEENRRIALDHSNLNCKMVVFTNNNIQCLLVYKVSQQRYFHIPVTKIHIIYLSQPNFFSENSSSILKYFRKTLGILSAIYVDKRFTKATKIYSFNKTINPPRIFYSPFSNPIEIDQLYSEEVLL